MKRRVPVPCLTAFVFSVMTLLVSCSSGTQAARNTNTGGNAAPAGGNGGTAYSIVGGTRSAGTSAGAGNPAGGVRADSAMDGSGGGRAGGGGASGSSGGAPASSASSAAGGGTASSTPLGGSVVDAGQGGAAGGMTTRDGGVATGGTSSAASAGLALGGTQPTVGSVNTGGNVAGRTKSSSATPAGGSSSGSSTSVDGCPVELVGWAAVEGSSLKTTTGGGNATPQRVTTIADFKSLAGDNTARVIEISGTIDTGSSPVDIASNKTVVGVNKSATIKGGINIREGSSNIIVRNLTIQGRGEGGAPADTVAARGSHHLWFDHLNVTDSSDGNLDLTKGSDFLTVSWSKFWYTDPNHSHRLSCLVGAGSTEAATDTGKNNVTYHHNWFAELVDQRMPRVLFGKGHVFNDYYTSTGNGYCVGSGSFAALLVEGNYFKGVKSPHRFQDTNPSHITARDNVYDNTTGSRDTGLGGSGGTVTPFTDPPYDYKLDATATVPDLITRCAGPQGDAS
jgi:pectate lyase